MHDMEVLFARLLVVGQQRGIDLRDVFDHKLSPVPPSLIDEYGCLRKGDKSILVKRLGVPDSNGICPKIVPNVFIKIVLCFPCYFCQCAKLLIVSLIILNTKMHIAEMDSTGKNTTKNSLVMPFIIF